MGETEQLAPNGGPCIPVDSRRRTVGAEVLGRSRAEQEGYCRQRSRRVVDEDFGGKLAMDS